MKSAATFLLAARQCEIGELEALSQTSELVGVIARLIHELQRERGTSNVYLASHGERFAAQRLAQVDQSTRLEGEVRGQFHTLDTDATRARNGARLFSRVAIVLHALDGLPALRDSVGRQALTPRESTAAYTRLVSGLLAVVFEAADSASDPQVSRALVSMFNFMQGKEFAGQERAFGAAVFASGRIDAAGRQQWLHLVESQQACFHVFTDFSDPAILAADLASQDAELVARLERLRRIGTTSTAALDPELSRAWYDCCTDRIDAMKIVEDLLSAHLRDLCAERISLARAELRDQSAMLESLWRGASVAGEGTAYGPHIERSLVAMVHEQSQRLLAVSAELETVRASLNERKLIERAKGVLMAERHLTEEDAHKALRRMAMNQNKRLADIAQAVLSMAEMLPGSPR